MEAFFHWPPVCVPSQYAPHPMREASDSIWRSGCVITRLFPIQRASWCVHQSNSSLDPGHGALCSSPELLPGLFVLLCRTTDSVELLVSPS